MVDDERKTRERKHSLLTYSLPTRPSDLLPALWCLLLHYQPLMRLKSSSRLWYFSCHEKTGNRHDETPQTCSSTQRQLLLVRLTGFVDWHACYCLGKLQYWIFSFYLFLSFSFLTLYLLSFVPLFLAVPTLHLFSSWLLFLLPICILLPYCPIFFLRFCWVSLIIKIPRDLYLKWLAMYTLIVFMGHN